MHFHAEHALFFEQRQPLWRPVLCLGLTVCVLVVNAGADSTVVSLFGAGIGALLLLIGHGSGARRVEPALAWGVVLVSAAILGGLVMSGEVDRFAGVAARVGCGVLWVLWVGSRVDWASLRRLLLAIQIPDRVVSALDHALMNGVFTKQEWARRRDAARLRLGKTDLSLRSWGHLLGEGALAGFLRLECAEESALMRSSPAAEVGDGSGSGIRLQGVHVERDGHPILKQIDCHMGAGDWVTLCGPSGAGKSSLLRLIAGLDVPSEGTMTRLGVTVESGTKLPARLDGRVALLAQNPEHHFIASTVAEDIAWGLLRRGAQATEADRQSKAMAEALGVDHLLARPCHTLSFGEQRRVALAGLLVLEPSLLLLDEPTSGLDPVAAYELRTLVEKVVHHTGAACIWATHDLDALPPQARRILLMRDGQVIFDGPADEGLSRTWLLRAGLAVPDASETAC